MGQHPREKARTAGHILISSLSFEAALARVALILGRLGATPNSLTFVSLVLALACGAAAATGAFLIAAAFLVASGVFDLLDGSLARATNRITAYGALLDSSLDRISDAAPLLGLMIFIAPMGWFAVIPAITLVGAFMISYVRARAESLGGKLPSLWMRRSDRLILLTAGLLVGPIHLPGVAVRAPLTILCLAVFGILNLWAFISALFAARACLPRGPHQAP